MPEQDGWMEDRYAKVWRDKDRYAQDEDRYRQRDYGERSFGYGGSNFTGGDRQTGYRSNRNDGDRYGTPSDYNYRGPRMDSQAQDYRGEGYAFATYDRMPSSSGRNGNDDRYALRGYGYVYGGQRGGDDYGNNDGYRETYGQNGHRRDLNDASMTGRLPENRSWWDKTSDEVTSWFGDEDAMRRRQQDDMRAGQHRGKGPKGYTRSDDRIREDVNDRLTDHGWLDASDIEAAVSNGEVTLNGTVARRADKRMAEDIADDVTGVKHVQNNLRVKEGDRNATTSAYGAATTGGQATTGATGKTN